ncbi:MAG: glycosyltransferase family A protein [Candidatus Omnitrophota bacterium]
MDVSIIIPTYNRKRHLSRCLESILCQKLLNFSYEILIIDDGSTDHTYEYLKNFLDSKYVRYFYQKNGGQAAARNTGIQNASGQILAFIDDDCIAHPTWLNNLLMAFQKNPNYDIIQGPYHYEKSPSLFYEATRYLNDYANQIRVVDSSEFSERKEALYIGTGNLGIRKSFFTTHRLYFNVRLSPREDEGLYRNIRKLNLKIGFLSNPVTHDCDSGPLHDMKRFFHYGRGEYHLQQSWGSYIRLPYKIKYQEISRKEGRWKGLIMKIIIEIRWFYWALGFIFESFVNAEFLKKKVSFIL